jgi:hypothetical protein
MSASAAPDSYDRIVPLIVNDMSAEAIVTFLGSGPYAVHLPLKEVAELLAELKASGDYDRIIAEAA